MAGWHCGMDRKASCTKGGITWGSFNGNDSGKLLKQVTILEELAPSNVQGFIDTFKAFNKVVIACYSKNLSPYYKQKIVFRKYYRTLGINMTPKVHVIFHHITANFV